MRIHSSGASGQITKSRFDRTGPATHHNDHSAYTIRLDIAMVAPNGKDAPPCFPSEIKTLFQLSEFYRHEKHKTLGRRNSLTATLATTHPGDQDNDAFLTPPHTRATWESLPIPRNHLPRLRDAH